MNSHGVRYCSPNAHLFPTSLRRDEDTNFKTIFSASVWGKHQFNVAGRESEGKDALEVVQAERLTSVAVVNHVAKLHYLQQHDNPFNT